MKGLFLTGLILLLSINVILAEEFNISNFSCEDAIYYKNQTLGVAKNYELPLSNEIVNVYISENFYGFFVIENKKIIDLGCSENEAATYSLFIENEDVIKELAISNNPKELLLEKINSKEITFKGNTFGKKIKSGFAKLGLRIFSWFN